MSLSHDSRHAAGFVSRCAAYGIGPVAARTLYKSAGFLDNAGRSLANTASNVRDLARADPVNYALLPAIVGGIGGGFLGDTFGGDDPRKRRRRRLTGVILGALALTAAKANGRGAKLDRAANRVIDGAISAGRQLV